MARDKETNTGYVLLTGTIEPEDNQVVSFCPELGVASCGDTVEEALDNLGDALQVHLNALEEIGELENTFQKRNIKIYQDTLASDRVSVTIPADKTVRVYPRPVPLAGIA